MDFGHDPEGKVLGILGMGGIGSAVARRAVAFDFKIQYHNRRRLPPHQNPLNATYVDFETLLRTSDAISVHLPLGDGTRGLIGKKEFAMMKEGVIIVNTARGPIIDESALVEAVQSGKVFGAGLDVYEREPEVSEGLVESENVILLPHVGTATYETQVSFHPKMIFSFFFFLLQRLPNSLFTISPFSVRPPCCRRRFSAMVYSLHCLLPGKISLPLFEHQC